MAGPTRASAEGARGAKDPLILPRTSQLSSTKPSLRCVAFLHRAPLTAARMNARIVATLLALVVLTPVALAATGPFSGSVRQGQTRTHHFDNNEGGSLCPQVMVWYTVELRYTPTSDVLTLSAGGQTATGSNGYAVVSFEASYCTSFSISVTGTQVASKADYTVTVTRGGGATA